MNQIKTLRSQEYRNGYDAGLNGPNAKNTHFSNFETKEQTADWEAGQSAGKKERARGRDRKHNPRKK